MRGRQDPQVTLLAFIDLETTWKHEYHRTIPCGLSRSWRIKP